MGLDMGIKILDRKEMHKLLFTARGTLSLINGEATFNMANLKCGSVADSIDRAFFGRKDFCTRYNLQT